MYRHFAAVTLAVTTALAMFADGENRQAKASQIVEREPSPQAKPATFATPPAAAQPPPVPSWWSEEPEFDRSFGRPTIGLFGRSSSSLMPEQESAQPAAYLPGGAASPSKRDRERLLRRLRESRSESSETSTEAPAPKP